MNHEETEIEPRDRVEPRHRHRTRGNRHPPRPPQGRSARGQRLESAPIHEKRDLGGAFHARTARRSLFRSSSHRSAPPRRTPLYQLGETEGLEGAISSVLSADGRTLYVAAFSDSAVVRFHRDSATGALTFLDAEYDDDAPTARSGSFAAKGNTYDGLLNVADLAISSDGEYLYSAGWGDDAIGVFRLTSSGNLVPLGAVRDPGMNRLDSVAALALSPNGTLLYSVASDARSVCALARDPALGSLTLTQCLVDPALAGARDLKVTADGNRLLVAATDAHSLVWIDLAGWPLPPLGALGSVSGLVGAGALALSPDEQDVYVASVAGQRVSHLRRSGPAYTLVDDYLVSMGGKTDVWVPPDGSAVFASNLHQHAVHRLTRDPLDGTLSDVSTFPLSTAGAGIQSPLGLTGSADGRTLYATSLSGHVTALWVDRGPVVDAIHSIGPGQPFRAAGVVAWSPTGDLYALTGGGGLLRLGRDPRSGAVRLLDQTSIQPEYRTFLVVTAKRIHLLGRQGAAARYGLDLAFQGSDVLPLSRVNDVVLSPDGTQLLAVSDADEALVALAIQPVNGSLYEIDRLDASDGLHDLLSEGYGIAISPDGARVYVASSRPRVAPPGVGGQVGVFDRALPGGELSFRGSHPTGREGSAHQVPQIAVSPDGRHVYATGIHGEDLYAWEETGTTLVGPVSTLLDGVDGVSGLVAVHDLAVSSDGRQVMTAAVRTTSTPGSVTLFHRDPVTGALSLRRSLQQLPGLDSPNGLLSAPAGHHLYVADAGTFQTPRGGIFVLDASALFLEGFETGDSSAWSASTP